jgi:hypothetical protein
MMDQPGKKGKMGMMVGLIVVVIIVAAAAYYLMR